MNSKKIVLLSAVTCLSFDWCQQTVRHNYNRHSVYDQYRKDSQDRCQILIVYPLPLKDANLSVLQFLRQMKFCECSCAYDQSITMTSYRCKH